MRPGWWTVLGSLTGLVVVPVVVGLAGLLVPDLGDVVFIDQGVPALALSGPCGVVLGGLVTRRLLKPTPRRLALLGSVGGAVVGATALGSVFLAVEVTGPDWPNGLAAFLAGSAVGASIGGIFGGVLGYARGDAASGRDLTA